MSRHVNRSKQTFQGTRLRSIRRSEFDDAMMRNQTRHDARLEEDIKTVDRAKDVMLKSMEAERMQFMKSGLQNNRKITGRVNPQTRSSLTATARRTSTDPKGKRNSLPEASLPVSTSENIENATPPPPSRTPKSSVVSADSAFVDTTSSSPSSATAPRHTDANNNNNNNNNHNHGMRGVNPNPIKQVVSDIIFRDSVYSDAYSLENDRRLRQGSKVGLHHGDLPRGRRPVDKASRSEKSSTPMQVLDPGDVQVMPGGNRRSNNVTVIPATVLEPERLDTKRSSVWDSLSEPRHTSMSRSKRSQLEREFKSPTAQKEKASAASGSMEKPGRTSATSSRPVGKPRAVGEQSRSAVGIRGKQLGN